MSRSRIRSVHAELSRRTASGTRVIKGRRLDRERYGHAFMAERGQRRRRYGEIGDRFHGGQGGCDRLRQGELAPGRLAFPVSAAFSLSAGAARSGASSGAVVCVTGACAVHSPRGTFLDAGTYQGIYAAE
jgi:hypothetical protein